MYPTIIETEKLAYLQVLGETKKVLHVDSIKRNTKNNQLCIIPELNDIAKLIVRLESIGEFVEQSKNESGEVLFFTSKREGFDAIDSKLIGAYENGKKISPRQIVENPSTLYRVFSKHKLVVDKILVNYMAQGYFFEDIALKNKLVESFK